MATIYKQGDYKIEVQTRKWSIDFRVLKKDAIVYFVSRSVGKQGMRIKDLEMYSKTLESIIKNIINHGELDYDKLEDYGWANGWNDKTQKPRMKQEEEDRKQNPYQCVLEIHESIGHCQTEVINWTYGYRYRYDSSD